MGADEWCGEQMAPTPPPAPPPLPSMGTTGTPVASRIPPPLTHQRDGNHGGPGSGRFSRRASRDGRVSSSSSSSDGDRGDQRYQKGFGDGEFDHTPTHILKPTLPLLYRRRVVYWFDPLCPLCFSDRWGRGARLSPIQIPGGLRAHQTQAWPCHIPVIQSQDAILTRTFLRVDSYFMRAAAIARRSAVFPLYRSQSRQRCIRWPPGAITRPIRGLEDGLTDLTGGC